MPQDPSPTAAEKDFLVISQTVSSENLNFIFLTHVLMFELFMYVYSCNALSARFFAVDRALNSYFMIMKHLQKITAY